MKRLFISSGTCVLILATAVLYIVLSSQPLKPGNYEIDGLSEPVTVQRDQFGIPYINANNKSDLYLALGFVHAADRIFQIDFLRRLVSGRLSEVIGSAGLKKDKLFSQLRFVEFQRELRQKRPELFRGSWFEELNAYVDGLNQFLELDQLPIEYKFLGYTPKKFEIEEVLAIGGYMAYGFAHGSKSDSFFGYLQQKLEPEVFRALWKTYPSQGPLIINPGKYGLSSNDENSKEKIKLDSEKPALKSESLNLIEDIDEVFAPFYGSNSWIVGPNKSATGNAVLVNDPHIGYSNPSVWYEASLHCKDFKLQGHFLSGFPFALVGHTTDHAWGLTMLSQDDMDLYLEKIDWDLKRVKRGDSWIKLKEYPVTIPVKNAAPVSYTVTWTDIGPLIDPFLKFDHKKPVSLFWSYFDPDNNIYKAFHGINNQSDISMFEHSVSQIISPGLNISYTNKQGDIAWWAAGRFINRSPDNPGHLPLNGENFNEHSRNYLPFSYNPKLLNPPQGYIITANNDPTGKRGKSGYYQPADRAQRIEQLIKAKQQLSINDHKRMLGDSVSILHQMIGPRLCKALTKGPSKQAFDSSLVSLFCQWNGEHETKEIGALLFQEWLIQLRILLTENVLTENDRYHWLRLTHSKHFLYHLFDEGHSHLLDIQNLSLDQAMLKAFDSTLAVLSEKYGKKSNAWRWGKAHQVTYKHPLGKSMWLSFLNLGPYKAPGLKDSINAVGTKFSNKRFDVFSGPSTRRIVDMADIDNSYSILPTGNSGNYFSRHYRDQIGKYLKKDFKKTPIIEFKDALLPLTWKLNPKKKLNS